ncbi:MAG: GNAT family N-acetyltransferase [Pseudomonadota bacterium]
MKTIRLAALSADPDAFGSTFAAERDRPEEAWRSRLSKTDRATFVCVRAAADVGLAVAAANEDGSASLYSVWAAPSERGGGVGDALIDACVAWARGEGFTRMTLNVGDGAAAAIRLYARHGFAPTGVVGSLPPPRDHILEHERARAL